ncbi:hypothetical protein ACO0QE_004389 [Hanseniaspora vineae]
MVQDIFQDNEYDLRVCCEKLTQSVSDMSSKHKFIVNVTEVNHKEEEKEVEEEVQEEEEDEEEDDDDEKRNEKSNSISLSVNNSFGTNWDNDKDGVVNCSVIDEKNGRIFMISVFWITTV